MRRILLAGVVLAISACSGGGSGNNANDANALAADNTLFDQNMMLDQNAMNGMDANGAVDANTQNLMEKDATTHDPDTNLANGL
jgi:hypothetical protein